MPPQRSPLGQASGNRQPSYKLSPYSRGQIVSASLLGVKPAQIAKGLKEHLATIQYTIKIDKLRNEGRSQARSL